MKNANLPRFVELYIQSKDSIDMVVTITLEIIPQGYYHVYIPITDMDSNSLALENLLQTSKKKPKTQITYVISDDDDFDQVSHTQR